MTFAPLRQHDFATIWGDSLPSSSEALPARTSAAPTPRAAASKANGRGSTSRQSDLSAKSDLVGSLLRTALISELGALTPSSLRWRHSATPAGRSWFVLETSAPTTSDRGHGSSVAMSNKLPTPMASDGMKDGAGGGSGSTYLFRAILSTPRASDMKAGGHGDTGRMGSVRHIMHEAEKLPTPTATRYGSQSYPEDPSRKRPSLETMLATPRKTDADRGFRGDVLSQLKGYPSKHAGMMPTPLKSDHKGSLGVMSGGKVKSPNVPTYLRDGKWDYARQIAAMLTEAGLTGPSLTLPTTYGWMMGYPPGWLARAFKSAMAKGNLLPASPSRRSGTPSSRKSLKQ